MSTLKISDIVPYPGGRYISDGPYSGEWFRENFLLPALKQAIAHNETLTVNLEGVPGYGISFLEEGFGGLIRKREINAHDIKKYLIIEGSSPKYKIFKVVSDDVINKAINIEKNRTKDCI
ncbi:STAS-like domain-containing protein [Gluconobacter cerinus]|uniref:STAS-like domain-containing protein n=1 Tax=Gluconobacter cerinus TaxID=38307 RepID=UPI001B8BFA8B|nr:DUF4325 domain-containing protein [Gluconobacter cerinus]MBS1037193.1 STAS-like domain-containing protein [Gluconobacter cerinus]